MGGVDRRGIDPQPTGEEISGDSFERCVCARVKWCADWLVFHDRLLLLPMF